MGQPTRTTDRQRRLEVLGPAERLIELLLTQTDHLVHNRPGVVRPDATSPIGVSWQAASYREEGGAKTVYVMPKGKKKGGSFRQGVLDEAGRVLQDGNVIGEYRAPGLFPEACAFAWRQIADVWRLDNEFAARWASYAFGEEHRDMKTALAAFLLVQSRRGDPVKENGQVLFFDDDLRDVGVAMCLLRRHDGRDLSPKLLLRIHDLLSLPAIAAQNRELGFAQSPKNPALGRWPKAVEKWLRHREHNPRLLEGLVKAGFRTTVMSLAQRIGYKPESESFFTTLRWKQKQSKDGRRAMAIGAQVAPAETWAGLTEAEICERIVQTRPNWKRLTGLLPADPGLTRAIATAAVQAGSLSNADLVILTPTLEDLGLLKVEPVKSTWERALRAAENQRAANIAARVRRPDTVQKLEQAAETVAKAAVAEVVRGLRIYFFLDISGSMSQSIEQGKTYISKFLYAFPLEQLHVAVFNTSGREVVIKHASSAGVEHAFKGFSAGGGTDYGSGVVALQQHRPKDGEDALFLFVGDQAHNGAIDRFVSAVQGSGLRPIAFGLLHIPGERGSAVVDCAVQIGVPCFPIDERIFADPYALTRTLRNLIAATPVGVAKATRVSLVAKILDTPLLQVPVWAE